MHGKNIVRHAEFTAGANPEGSLQVHEVFYTLQGEGPFAGRTAVFVRLTGCNLRCWFCDTAWNDDDDPCFDFMDLRDQVFEKMPEHCSLVVITGGEPMRQRLAPFISALHVKDPNVQVQIETAGTLWQPELDRQPAIDQRRLHFVVSPKTPAVHARFHTRASAFKYIIDSGCRGLFPPYAGTQVEGDTGHLLATPPKDMPVYLSPCDEDSAHINAMNHQTVAKLALEGHGIAGIQLHKYLRVP